MYPFPLRAERRNVPNVLGMMGIKERRGYKWIVPLNRQKEKLKKKKKNREGGERERAMPKEEKKKIRKNARPEDKRPSPRKGFTVLVPFRH